MMSIYLGLIAITQWHNVDFLMLHAAPSKDKVCRVMKSRYYLDVNPDNIYAECRPNDNNKTNDFYYKKVVYYISMMDENSEINFTCSWIPFHGITSDYEMALINEYFEEQSINVIESSLYERNYDGELSVNIENAEDKEVFMKQFKNAMENILSNNYLREWFTTIEFTIWLEEAVHGDWVQVYFDVYFDDNIAEVLDKLSDDLNVYLR